MSRGAPRPGPSPNVPFVRLRRIVRSVLPISLSRPKNALAVSSTWSPVPIVEPDQTFVDDAEADPPTPFVSGAAVVLATSILSTSSCRRSCIMPSMLKADCSRTAGTAVATGRLATAFDRVAAMRRSSASSVLSRDASICVSADRSARLPAPLPSIPASTGSGSPARSRSNTSGAHAVAALARASFSYAGRPVSGAVASMPSRFRSRSSVTKGAKMPMPFRPSRSLC